MQPVPPDEPRCAALVLAAGCSARLGTPKQLLAYEGEALLRRTVRLAQEAGYAPIVVVVGAYEAAMREDLAGLAITVITNPEWRSGMGSSLRTGVQAAIDANASDPLLVLVCDQPALTAALLARMKTAHLTSGHLITAAQYGGRLGVPALFAPAIFPELLNIQGDKGAREIINRHMEEVLTIPFEGGALDIDLPQDMARLTVQTRTPGA